MSLHLLDQLAEIMAHDLSGVTSEFISVKLSEVMADIGLTRNVIRKRRKSFKIMEVVDTSVLRILSKKITTYNLGSQSEGSTTVELDLDIDTLFSYHDLIVIQDWNNRIDGAQNVLMVQNETTAPSHCLLQVQSSNISFPYPDTTFDERDFFKDGKGRLLLKNTCFNDKVVVYNERNGPAHSFCGNPAQNDEDNVIAWHCNDWPKEACFVKEGWPAEDIKRECEATGCTIVPVSSKHSQYKDLEWRISTCLAERCLMFSLNITQMRCYVLMKMIIKTFIKPKYPKTISSYICKTVLFHCIHNESSLRWNENHLIQCLTSCLHLLKVFVMAEECPHFIIPGNNLLAGKISEGLKNNLVADLTELQNTLIKHLLKISCDCLGIRLFVKLKASEKIGNLENTLIHPRNICQTISQQLLRYIAAQLSIRHKSLLRDMMLYDRSRSQICFTFAVSTLKGLCHKTENELEKSAYKLLIPFMCSSLASTMASNELEDKKAISKEH
ncbi:uncharacterized protein LOC132751467 [Ruditapes philippinarum]|uniref:uncharacterized protein LOC132751467 n=1 Tax=Ruditapes philippinarum TaxID=129788 RepID=UPI00295BCCB2|nr:uncharacterized protein LOC132751467 [Ruditapes philippinarum]